jgi:AraC-like DNA-binding protein
VAEKCGFSDPSHFARRFRRQFGTTPLQYRRTLID